MVLIIEGPDLSQAVKAGILYFIGAFALGFLFGGVRLMLLTPTLGELVAVVIEVPVMLGFCWIICGRAIARLEVPPRNSDRITMGFTALAFLLAAELALATVMFGDSPADYAASMLTAAGAIGLGGQFLFAVFPLAQLRWQP